MKNVCGHCGTEVAKNYSVCKGCGAHLRRSGKMIGIGIFVTLVAVQMLVTTLQEFNGNLLSSGILGLAIGLLFIKSGFTKKWYRHNS